MQYADDPYLTDDSAAMRPRIRRRMLEGMDAPSPVMDPVRVPEPLVDASGRPRSGNTGVTGGMTVPRPTPTPPPTSPAPAPAARGGTYRDVLSSVWTPDVLGGIRSAGTEDAKKAVAEQAIRSVLPQLQQMGVQVDDVRNEKIQIGGKWYDLLKDVSGAAVPQFLDVAAHEARMAAAGSPQTGTMRGMDSTQTSLIDQIRAAIMQLMGNGGGVG